VGRVYSERFLRGNGASANYYCPPGKRAVIKSITAFNVSAGTLNAQMSINDLMAVSFPVPPGTGASLTGLHLVVYSGEKLSLEGAAAMYQAVSGFLLDELN